MMRVQGAHRSDVAAPVLWAALSDPERLGEALPEVGPVDVASPDAFSATVLPATNLGVTPLALAVRITERDEPERVRIVGEGDGFEHRVTFDVELRFTPVDTGGCTVAWDARVQAFGGLASLTQRVLPMLLRDQIGVVLRTAETQTRETVA
jgi:carbon monoxide dehydrogenase subunit G